jgi:putative flippase GtrA/GT2 family glycosyltransferase
MVRPTSSLLGSQEDRQLVADETQATPARYEDAAQLASTVEPSMPSRSMAQPGLLTKRLRMPAVDRSASPDRTDHGFRFASFSAIGAFVFALGIVIQLVMTAGLHVPPMVSYMTQAVVSVETSFLLNRWFTWYDRSTPFLRAFARFNAQKVVAIALNAALYAVLLKIGVNYLVANVVLTAAFTVVNYLSADRLVFTPTDSPTQDLGAAPVTIRMRDHPTQRVTVVIPCRDRASTIGATVRSVLDQDYPALDEIILIGSPADPTWEGLAEIDDPRIIIDEVEAPPGLRDANFKRVAAIRMSTGELIALIDSDVVLPSDWLSSAVATMNSSGVHCVAGGIRTALDNFWGRYTDRTWIGAKTPRVLQSYMVTRENFGARGRKPPITANALVTRELFDACPIDPTWSHGSYEDYEWFWRATKAGYQALVCRELFGWHYHRSVIWSIIEEHLRSARGCAHFIRAHPECPLSKRRLRQVVFLPAAAVGGLVGISVATAVGAGVAVGTLALLSVLILAGCHVVRSRSLEGVAYLAAGVGLGLVFTAGLARSLFQTRGLFQDGLAS